MTASENKTLQGCSGQLVACSTLGALGQRVEVITRASFQPAFGEYKVHVLVNTITTKSVKIGAWH